MKLLKYFLLLVLFVSAAACKSDETPDGPSNGEAREKLMKATEMGAYQDGISEFAFDQKTQQIYVAPSNNIIRLQTDAGSQYVELQLASMPALNASAAATLRSNVGLKTKTPGDLTLIKSENNRLWLFSESTGAGYILPWFTE